MLPSTGIKEGSEGAVQMVGPRPGTRERAFAKRLEQALNDHPRCPEGYGRNTWLMRELTHENVTVSLETVRKWLSGETMPRRAKMTALAKILHVDETWLAMGAQIAGSTVSPKRAAQLESALRKIETMTADEEIKRLIALALKK